MCAWTSCPWVCTYRGAVHRSMFPAGGPSQVGPPSPGPFWQTEWRGGGPEACGLNQLNTVPRPTQVLFLSSQHCAPHPPFSLALGHVAGLTMPGPAPVNPQVLGRHGGVWGPGLHPRISETMCWFSGATVKIGTTEVASHGRDSPSQSWSSDVQCHGPKIGGSEGHAPPGAAGRPFLAPCDFGWPISPTLPLLSYTRTLVTAFRATWGIQDDVLTLITSAKTRFPNEGSGTAHACGGAGEASGTECACPGGDVSTRPGLEVGAEPPPSC